MPALSVVGEQGSDPVVRAGPGERRSGALNDRVFVDGHFSRLRYCFRGICRIRNCFLQLLHLVLHDLLSLQEVIFSQKNGLLESMINFQGLGEFV